MTSEITRLEMILTKNSIKEDIYDKICNKLCMLYYNGMDKDKAIESLMKKKRIDHNDLSNIAKIFFELQNYLMCCKYFEYSLDKKFDIEIAYKLATIYNQLGNSLNSYRTYKNILTLEPDHVKSINNIAEIKMVTLRQNEAIEDYKKAFDIDNRFAIYSNIIMNMYYTNFFEESVIKKYFELVSSKIKKISLNTQVLGNKIRIGYISQEFLITDENKPVNCFVKHIFENHSDKFEVYCYYVHRNKLIVKETSSLYTDQIDKVISRNLTGMTIHEIVKTIANDKLHVLVELMNHTSANVLEILQHKPARVQVSYCAFPGTTGIDNIDYKVLDAVTNYNTSKYTEKVVCMNRGFHCYCPTYKFPDKISVEKYGVMLEEREYYHLASFANPKKLNGNLLRIWSLILKNENVVLYLRHPSYSSSYVQKSIQLEFEKHEIFDRVIFIGNSLDYTNALNLYNSIDIFLDTFPYNGTTTICESLLMNVPVVTLQGETVESRIGSSLLMECGLYEYICYTEDEYVSKVETMLNKSRLINIRREIEGVNGSYLFDKNEFIMDYEKMIRSLI